MKNIVLAILAIVFTLTIFINVSAQVAHDAPGSITAPANEKNTGANIPPESVTAPPGDQNIPAWLLLIFLLLAVAVGMLIAINLLRKP